MSVQPIVGVETGGAIGAVQTPGSIVYNAFGLPQRPNTFPAGSTTTGTAHTATAQSAHNMLKALMLELGFVVVGTMLAGINDSWGSAMLVLMLGLLVLRGLFEVDLFAAFAQSTVLHT